MDRSGQAWWHLALAGKGLTMWEKLAPYRKFLVALAVAVAVAAWPVFQAAIGDGSLSGEDWRVILLAAGGAVLVYLTPNKSGGDVPPPR